MSDEDRQIAPERVSELADSGEAQLVDVRLPEEWEAGHVAGATHIPIDSLSSRAGEIDRSKRVVLYCRSGDRSGGAADALAASGWDVTSMEGGLVAWVEQGLPLEPEGGEVVAPSGLPPA
jgi:rhodanese-related sulfurtransferase